MSKAKLYVMGVATDTKAYMADYNRIMNESTDPDMARAEEMYIDALHDVMLAHFEFKATAIESYEEHLGTMREEANPVDIQLEGSLRNYAKRIYQQLVDNGLYDNEGQLRVKHNSTLHCSMMVLDSLPL